MKDRMHAAIFRQPLCVATALIGLGGLGGALPASAQTAPNTTTNKTDNSGALEEIVITGTLIRNLTPVGSNLISVGEQQAQSQGATTVDELLSTVPQVTNLFNNDPSSRLNVAPNQIQVVRPNLRNLSPETGSSSSTLVLFDGVRIAGVGVTQSAIDPDLMPIGAIERVEVVTDGGSATYGADAVGGVINFITRKHFDGVKVGAHDGFVGGYHTYDANATAGKDWGSGSLYVSYMYQMNDPIFGRDRGFIRQVDWTTPTLTPTGRRCSPGNVTLPGAFNFSTFTFGPSTNYGLPNLTTPGVNACDLSDDTSFVPKAVRNSVFSGLHQEFNDAITMDVRAFYGERTTTSYGPTNGTATVTRTNAFYQPAAANPTATQTVNFSLDPVLGVDSASSGTHFREWGVNTEVDAKLTDKWHVRTLLNYSDSNSTYHIPGLNQTLLTAAGSASDPQTAANFYNPAATPNLSVIQAIANSELAGEGKDSLLNARTVLDGALFELPGGDVSAAAGYEYMQDSFHQRIAPPNAIRGAVSSVAFTPYERHIHSVFGETQVPIIGDANRIAGIYSLILMGSVRHDQFSDFGGTTNFKYGATYKPISWLALRGNFNTSFNAPSPVDQLGSLANTISYFPFNAFVRPGDTPIATGTVALQGSAPNLAPQTARTYSFGADIDPVPIPGLRTSVNYYHVAFDNVLDIPTPNAGIFANFPNNVTTNVNGVTAAQLLDFAKLAPNGPSVVQPLISSGLPVYEIVNFLRGNYGQLNVSGLDFSSNYRRDTAFGGLDGSVAGNYTLKRTTKLGPGAPVFDQIAANPVTGQPGSSRLQMQVTLGTDIRNFRFQATLDHSSGFDVVPTSTLPQSHVGSFDTVNLFGKYTIGGDHPLLKNLSFTLNINNVFDRDPPVYKLSTPNSNGFYDGYAFTVGRLVMLGVSDSF
jgi:iron complex outermembrane receptor protein